MLQRDCLEFAYGRNRRTRRVNNNWSNNNLHHSPSLDSDSRCYRSLHRMVFDRKRLVGWRSLSRYCGVVNTEKIVIGEKYLPRRFSYEIDLNG